MTLKEIQDLIKFVAKSGASEVSLEMGDVKLSIKTEDKKKATQVETVLQQMPVQQVAQPMAAAPVQAAPALASAPAVEDTSVDDDSKYVTVKSPIIGTFYRKSSPDKDAFVNVGDDIKAGAVVCIVEAMKLFNEIESDVSGKVIKILADDMSPVEYDQPLFLVDPS